MDVELVVIKDRGCFWETLMLRKGQKHRNGYLHPVLLELEN